MKRWNQQNMNACSNDESGRRVKRQIRFTIHIRTRPETQNTREVRSIFDGMRLLQWLTLCTITACSDAPSKYQFLSIHISLALFLLLAAAAVVVCYPPYHIIGFVLKNIIYFFRRSTHESRSDGFAQERFVCMHSFYSDAFLLMT